MSEAVQQLVSRNDLSDMVLVMAQELRPHLMKVAVRGDGNCYYRAIAHLLGEDWTHETVRNAIIEEVLAHEQEYVGFVPNNDVRSWAEQHVNLGEYNSDIAPKAAANRFGPLVIWRLQAPEQDPVVFVPSVASETDNHPPLYLELDEASRGSEHFSPLAIMIPDDVDKNGETKKEGDANEKKTEDAKEEEDDAHHHSTLIFLELNRQR